MIGEDLDSGGLCTGLGWTLLFCVLFAGTGGWLVLVDGIGEVQMLLVETVGVLEEGLPLMVLDSDNEI